MSPPTNAAGHQVVHRRITKHMDAADAASERRSRTSKVTMGPNTLVIGAKSTPSNSIDPLTPKFWP